MGKRRPVIAVDCVPTVFNDGCIRKLARIGKLPPDADVEAFGAAVRDAARIFARDVRIPNSNELHDEIATLYRAADRRLFEQVADLVERLSPKARELLCGRANRIGHKNVSAVISPPVTAVGRDGEILTRVSRAPLRFPLPTPSDLRDEASREAACEVVARLCWMGCQFVEGRRRPSGKQSRHIARPLLFAPKPRRHFPRRDAERNFVMLLSIAWVEATGVAASRTARHRDASRNIGPFARFVRECLQLVGAKDADAVELINELHRRRRAMERRTTSEGLSDINP